jgi:predicted SnoaL-like aldol condensation-catalyzing enzyme
VWERFQLRALGVGAALQQVSQLLAFRMYRPRGGSFRADSCSAADRKKLQDNEPGVETRGTEGFMSDLEGNKQVVVDYYQTAFNGNPEKAVADHFGPRYIQHNPEAQDGPEAFIGFVRWLRDQYPNLQLDIKRVIAEGDMVVTHSHLDLEPGNPDNPGRALADFFRVENGKVVEHWDVIQEIPATSANNNGMF